MAIPKGVKYTFLALGPTALVISGWFFYKNNESPVAGSYLMADVVTGQVTSLATSKIISIPAANEKGELTLVRVEKDPSGAYVVIERDRELISGYFGGRKDLRVDPSTFRIQQQ